MSSQFGSYTCKLDGQHRLTVPAMLRDPLTKFGDTWVMTIDYQSPCIAMFPYAQWGQVADRIQALPVVHQQLRNIRRRFLGNAREVTRDKNARFALPPLLRELAGITDSCVLVALGGHLELWSTDAWQSLNQSPVNTDEIPADIWSQVASHLQF